jgi:Flp pilus assembly pilin Flp
VAALPAPELRLFHSHHPGESDNIQFERERGPLHPSAWRIIQERTAMKVTSWLLQSLSNDDNCTDLLEFVLMASVLLLGLVATFATVTERIGTAFSTIASHL